MTLACECEHGYHRKSCYICDAIEDEKEIEALRDERDRLREIIRKEGEKWAEHHTDIEKKKYWAAFALKAGRPK